MRKLASVILAVMMLLAVPTVRADGILPALPREDGSFAMPSLGEALQRYPEQETENGDGSITEFYPDITETEYYTFSAYLEEQGAELADYTLQDSVLTAEIKVKGASFILRYDRKSGEAELTYPAGTFDAWTRNAKEHFDTAMGLLAEGKPEEAYAEIFAIPQFSAYKPVAGLLENDEGFAAAAVKAFPEMSGERIQMPTPQSTDIPAAAADTPAPAPVQEETLPVITSAEWSDEEDTVVLTVRRNGATGRMYISTYAGNITDQSYHAYGTPVLDTSETVVYSMKNDMFVPGVTFVVYPQLDRGGGSMEDLGKVEITIPIGDKPGNSIGIYDFHIDDMILEDIAAVRNKLRSIRDEKGTAAMEAVWKDEFDSAFSASLHVTGYVRALITAPDGRMATNAISIGNARDLKTALGEAFFYQLPPQAGKYTVQLFDWGNKCLIGAYSFNVVPGTASPESGSGLSAGDTVVFGRYEQDGNQENGREAIEWIVLEVQDGKVLLISRYGLDSMPYDEKRWDVTWETCTLRAWLNREFLSEAFSTEEQAAILVTAVDNSSDQGYEGWETSGGNNTQDRVFLLSCAEANKYFGVDYATENAVSRMAPTAYALAAGAYTLGTYTTADGTAAAWWWLRSTGSEQSYAADVTASGKLYSGSAAAGDICIRPAVWVSLEDAPF